MSQNRCPCGARIVWVDEVNVKKGLRDYIYTCGVCGTQIEIQNESDPTKH